MNALHAKVTPTIIRNLTLLPGQLGFAKGQRNSFISYEVHSKIAAQAVAADQTSAQKASPRGTPAYSPNAPPRKKEARET